MTPTSKPTSHGAGLLETWLQNPLDEGYAEAAARKAAATETDGPHSHARASNGRGRLRADSAWTIVGCLLIGLVLVIAYQQTHRDAPTDARTRADLRAQITQAQNQGNALESSARALDNQVAARQAAALGTGSNSALTRAQAQAGTTAVAGPGVRVSVGNPGESSAAATTGRAGTTPLGDVAPLTDTDVRAIVNQLWLDGAEAIAINGVRLTPLSAIRFAGQAVLVDFQPVTAPYSIDAIGDSNQLITAFTDSSVAVKYRTLASAEGFSFSINEQGKITMPASVLAQPHYASTVPASTVPAATAPTPTPAPTRTGTPAPLPTPSPTPSGQPS